MATRLNQILAVEKGVKGTAERGLTTAYHDIQKTGPMAGLTRTYRPLADGDTELLPAERTNVQYSAQDVIARITASLTRLFDVTATKDYANRHAVADVVVDGVTLVEAAPVTYLLFLEKKLTDLHAFIKRLPILDPAENWTVHDAGAGIYKTDPTETVRTKKIPRAFELAPATDKHPAQMQPYYEDQVVGYWTKIGFSGALPAARVTELLARVEKLQEAVKFARGEKIFGYLFR
jgi:hypothetical protein